MRGKANQPPETLTIRATLTDEANTYSQDLSVKVAPDAELDAKPDLVEFTAKSGKISVVKVGIANPGPLPWAFRTEYDKKDRQLATVTLKPVAGSPSQTLLNLQEAGLDPLHDGSNTEVAVLKIFAEQKDREPLERDIKVSVAQEGLFVAADGRDPNENLFRLRGDGSGKATEIYLRVFGLDPATNKIVNLTRSADALSKISVELLDPKGSAGANVLEVGQLKKELKGILPNNEPAAILRLSLAKELPGDGRIIPCDFRITYAGRSEEAFSSIITVGVVMTSDGPGGNNWQLELDRCQEIISKFVPATYQPKLQAMLDRRKMTLGAEGLALLRQKIWLAAANLTLGEGGRGYADEARWADYITESLEWTQWAGDMAFGAAVGSFTGPFGSAATTTLKGMVISAINAYQDGQSAQEWLWGNLCTIPGIIEGKVIDVQTFEKLGVQNKAKAWAIYVSYHFLKNLYNGQSLIEALKNTAKEAGSSVLSSWLAEEVKSSGNRTVTSWAADKTQQAANTVSSTMTKVQQALTGNSSPDAPQATAENQPPKPGVTEEAEPNKKAAVEEPTASAQPSPAQEAEAISLVRSGTVQVGNKLYADHEHVLAIMRDPSMVRALKTAPRDVQDAFSNTREAIYREHDAEVVQHVRDTVPDMQNRIVRVLEFRTPGETGPSLNTDRDYRVCYFTADGKWIEVPRQNWENKSYETFARLTGGPTASPESSREWAAQHQQRGADKYDIEASAAFSDQKTIWNEQTRQFEKVQVTSNFVQVAKGQIDGVDIEDPQGLGLMYQTKVSDAQHPHEAFVQANKAVDALTALRKSYNVQGRDIGQVPEKILAGMQAVATVNEQLKADPNRRDPAAIAEANQTLRANGFNDLNDFIKKMGGQFESLKTMKQPKGGE